MNYLLLVAAASAWAVWLGRAGLVVARMYQIEEYEAPRLFAWGHQPRWLFHRTVLVGTLLAASIGAIVIATTAQDQLAPGAGLLGGAVVLNALWRWIPPKKELVYTPRMRRILSAAAGLGLLVAVLLGVAIWLAAPIIGLAVASLALLLSAELTMVLVVGGNLLMTPVEASIRQKFVRQAQARIRQYGPRVISVAGSYGKTSTKHITAQLLAPQINTFPTPKSFNTLMGITRTINEYLEPAHKLFVVEMDAYGPGEIADMAALVEPELAVITSIGPQHLERFGTIANIRAAMYELVAALPANGPVVVYAGEAESAQLADQAARDGRTVVRYGFADEPGAPFDVTASAVQIDSSATHFTWAWPARGLERRVSIPLLGKHNILNTAAGLAVTVLLGFDLDRAIAAAAQLEPVPHRLQRLPSAGGVLVIDDSYNANPVGVHNGLEVLQQIEGRQKILVTPGMVELGSVQDVENQRFGEHAAAVCQHVILVGKRQTQPIYAGLQAKQFPASAVHVVETLAEVTALLGQISGPGDVVLFANDLPDTYLDA